ncbi:MAG: ABC transporter permease [Chitinophagaceae bacterium]|nr:ABC transporter permease [Chitinophagaceae bacterium]
MKVIGEYMLFLGQLFVRREKFKIYVTRTRDECILIGYNTIFLVSIVSFFIGAVTTIQIAYNLVSPFVPRYIISNVLRSMTLTELASTFTGVIFAGKIASNIAGELGTMRVTEQIDALEVMGINSISYLVLPKIIASVFTYPLLVIIAIFLTFLGGSVSGTLTNLITGYDFVYGLQYEFRNFEVFFPLIKSFFFGFFITSISAFIGFNTKGGALEVGRASTSAVTNSCIAILITDFVLAKLLLT